MENRENQQQITETDKAWLAGFIEGDGSISMGFHLVNAKKSSSQKFACKPTISVHNTDALLIEKALCLFQQIANKTPYVQDNIGNYKGSTLDVISLKLMGMACVLQVLKVIYPYLYGSKAGKARMMITFIEHRLEKERQRGTSGKFTPGYDLEDIIIMKWFYEHTEPKGEKRNKAIGEMLRDYTQDLKRG